MNYQELETDIFKHYPNGKKHCELISDAVKNYVLTLDEKNPPYTMIATGGLGRREQGIHSDIDLLFLADSPEAEKMALELVKKFWDSDTQVGYSIRQMENVWEQALEDETFLTTILFTDFISGSEEMYEKFLEEKKSFFQKNRSLLLSQFYPEFKNLSHFEKEHEIFLNQPYLKKSFGGLRGFQLIQWFLAVYPEYNYMKESPVYQSAQEGYYHIWAVRNIASMVSGRNIDQLQLDVLAKILECFQDKEQFQAEEFLKQVFIASSKIYDLVLLFKEIMQKELPLHKKIVRFFRKKKQDSVISVLNKKVYVNEKKGSAYLKGILYAVKSNFEVSSATLKDAQHYFLEHKGGISPEEISLFKEFFELEGKCYHGFYYLHHSFFLSALIPHYGDMILRPQLDFHHTYTLGEHSLLTLKHLSKLFHDNSNSLSHILFDFSQRDRETLIYAFLLHDIGKIREGNHITNNKKMIDEVLAPLPLANSQKEDIAFLAIQHLLMSHVAQREDIHRIKVVLSFAEKVRTVKRLKMLYLLTVCDMLSVSDRPIQSFIEVSMKTLFFRTEIILSEGSELMLQENERDEILKSLENLTDAEALEAVKLFPDEYLFEVNNKAIAEDLNRLKQAKEKMVDVKKTDDQIQVRFYGNDEPGILSSVVAGLTLSQLNILDSRVYTLKDGRIVDYFLCNSMLEGDFTDEKKAEVEKNIAQCIEKKASEDYKKAFYNKLYYWMPKNFLTTIETQVEVQKLHDGVIYLLISSQDFPGILYFLTRFFYDNGLSIIRSKINTMGLRVHDAFYLEPKQGLDWNELAENLKSELIRLREEVMES